MDILKDSLSFIGFILGDLSALMQADVCKAELKFIDPGKVQVWLSAHDVTNPEALGSKLEPDLSQILCNPLKREIH